MKATEIERTDQITPDANPRCRKIIYQRVFDGRKQRVRGLSKRGLVYYGRFAATNHSGRTGTRLERWGLTVPF